MDIAPIAVRYYKTQQGDCPVKIWLHSLTSRVKHIVDKRLMRVRLGLLGDYRHISGGVFELRIHFGPGYRLYFGMKDRTLVLLLKGGDKGSQTNDILAAKKYWEDYTERCTDETF